MITCFIGKSITFESILLLIIIIIIILDRYTLDLIFGTLLRCDMKEFMGDWNNHMIRRNQLSNSPSGRPQDMYDLPELQGKHMQD